MLIDFYGLERFNKKQCIKCIVEKNPDRKTNDIPSQFKILNTVIL